MKTPIIYSEPELTYLRKYFDGVDAAITDEMQAGATLQEENLTFVLARLLDQSSTFQKILAYPLSALNEDLSKCGSAVQITIEFETNEHKKSFESAVSHADLGIIVKREHSVIAPAYTKAIIVQSKKLYPSKDTYRISSGYDAFDQNQYKGLKELASKYSWNGVFYFLYNPKLGAFAADDAKILRALESSMSPYTTVSFWHPEIEFFLHKVLRSGRVPYLFPSSPSDSLSPEELRDEKAKILDRRPGLRVMGIGAVGHIVESKSNIRNSFSLRDCYRYTLSERWWGSSGTTPFVPLSLFMVDLLMGCIEGTDNRHITRVAEGVPPEPRSRDEEPPPRIAARHMLVITIRYELPQMDVVFHQ